MISEKKSAFASEISGIHLAIAVVYQGQGQFDESRIGHEKEDHERVSNLEVLESVG